MAVHVRLETFLPVAVDVAFDLGRDLDLHAASMAHTGERAVGGRTSGRIEAGETVTWEARHLGRTWRLTSRIVAFEPPHRFVDEQVRGPFAWFRHEHRFESTDGGTRMVDDWRHASPLGPLGWLVDLLVLSRYMRRQLEARNAAIVRAAAGNAPSGTLGAGR